MPPNPQPPVDLVTFTEEILDRKFHFLCSANSVFDIQDYFEYTIKRHDIVGKNSPIKIYNNRIENGVVYLRLRKAIN